MLPLRAGPEPAVDGSKLKDVSGELLSQNDDEEDARIPRHPLLLRLPRALEAEESLHVWLLQPQG
jgi:hypothetical protein